MNKTRHPGENARLLGYPGGSGERPAVKAWTPLDEKGVESLPPLPRPQPRGWEIAGATAQTAPAVPSLPEGIGEDTTHAYIFHHPQEAAAVLRTLIRREEGGGGGGPLAGLTARQVVSIFLIALGKEIGSRVLGHLSEGEIEYMVQGIALQGEITHEQGLHALEKVRQRMVSGDYVEIGGEDYARHLLESALGPYRAPQLLDRALHPNRPWGEVLKNMAPDQIAPFISQEHPQTIALILAQLEPAQAAGILTQLPERLQSDVALRIATMENITPAVLKHIGESLEASLRDILGGNKDVGGPQVVADILNLTGTSVEKNVLDQMDAQNPAVAEAVRHSKFAFNDLARLTDREIQTLLREVDQKDLVVALKSASEEVKQKILGNMSERVRAFITEELEFLGPMRLSEVEEVQLKIVHQMRQLERQGQVLTAPRGTEDVFV